MIGNYGFGNYGDEAMLTQNVRHLKSRFPRSEIIVASMDPEETSKVYKVKSCHLLSPCIFFTLLRSDVLTIGSGSLFNSRFAYSLNRMSVYVLVFALLAMIFRKKIMFHAIGVETEELSWITRILLPKIINKSESVSVRSVTSRANLKKLGVTKKINVVLDPALKLRPVPRNRARKLLVEEGVIKDGLLIGLNARYLNHKEKDAQVMNALAKTIDFLVKKHKAKILFIPLAMNKFKKIENDLNYAYELSTITNIKSDFVILRKRYTPSELLGIIREMDFVIGMRLHALVFAYNVGVPFISINYSPKNTGFLETIGQEKNGIDPNRLNVKWLKEKCKFLASLKF